jgi:hypothetical protein
MTVTSRSVSRAKLCLYVAAWIAASTSFGSFDANAFACLPSAEAVKQEDPTAWPSWTLRAPGFEGKKCWYSSTRAGAHDHQQLPSREPAAVIGKPRDPEPAVVISKPRKPEPTVVFSKPREPEPEVTGSASLFEQARTAAPDLISTFEDRFLAVCPTAEPSVPGCGSQLQPIGRRTNRSKFF